ncbi:DUF1425 domain-containing protein [Verrucomicrobiota bacterium]
MRVDLTSALALLAVFSAGCVTSAPTTVEKQGDTYRVTVNSLILNKHIRVLERSTRRTNGLLEAQIRSQNVSRRDVQFEYRFIWLDADGIRLDTATSTWKPLHLAVKEAAFMTGICPSPDGVDFLMAVRFVQKATRW